jgi:hypothetical protein
MRQSSSHRQIDRCDHIPRFWIASLSLAMTVRLSLRGGDSRRGNPDATVKLLIHNFTHKSNPLDCFAVARNDMPPNPQLR